ncbi:MAG: ferritin family protein [Pseudomonadota bacterium]
MAEEIERKGCQFYQEAARGVADPVDKSFLLDLSRMEIEHQKIFSTMRENLTAEEKGSNLFDPQDEAATYLKSLSDMQVFYKKKLDTTNITEILKSAIVAEKDSILYYLGMKDFIPVHLGQAKIDAIIREERGHVTLLTQQLLAHKEAPSHESASVFDRVEE